MRLYLGWKVIGWNSCLGWMISLGIKSSFIILSEYNMIQGKTIGVLLFVYLFIVISRSEIGYNNG